MTELSQNAKHAQAFLFMEGGPLSWKRLAHLIARSEEETKAAVQELSDSLHGSGLSIAITDRETALVTSAETSERVKQMFAEQLERDIGEAGLEVLATILYRGDSKRSEVDYIRGVNTASTVRALLSRGLIERSALDGREYIYKPTPELLAHLGVQSVEELPEYATIRSELAAFENSRTPFDEHAGETTNGQPGAED